MFYRYAKFRRKYILFLFFVVSFPFLPTCNLNFLIKANLPSRRELRPFSRRPRRCGGAQPSRQPAAVPVRLGHSFLEVHAAANCCTLPCATCVCVRCARVELTIDQDSKDQAMLTSGSSGVVEAVHWPSLAAYTAQQLSGTQRTLLFQFYFYRIER